MFKHLTSIFAVLAISGCVATSDQSEDSAQHLQQVNNKLDSMEKNLTTQIDAQCQQDNQALVDELVVALEAQKVDQKAPEKEIVYVENCSEESKDDAEVTSDKMIVGGIESVFFTKEKLKYSARIDTGAVTSSLGVYNEKRFERDGKKWVRFSLNKDENAHMYEYPIDRIIRIIQQTSSDVNRRPVIKMRFKLGDKDFSADFSLADRDHLEYQVLLGREFLQDIAMVDVSAKFLQGGE
ncbi:RimK/LysX family protein [Thalassotalea sp. Y01]|uniref:ATP-dependent zinc protease family protein n=1 Tax=Thalassotalea sp. Y01 TaxID=2729613 RepID=UPI00145F39B8|nr:RimK/LysX family protein [Thalassotalea sp. Y01]NMP17217.1 hypothetical protein [Thalassotalea sp. Y01]